VIKINNNNNNKNLVSEDISTQVQFSFTHQWQRAIDQQGDTFWSQPQCD
jgi:hypothetical protein